MTAVAGKKVLIVEDDAALRETCRDILTEEGLTVVEATDGPSGLAAARRERPDAIVLDIAMPGMDGYQVAEALVAEEPTAAIPILFLTARDAFSDQLRGYEAGGVEYIIKPFDLATFVMLVHRQLERATAGSPASASERLARIGALRLLLGVE